MTTQPDGVSTAPTTVAAADNRAHPGFEPVILDGDATTAYLQARK